jgi:hypothetical protein
MGRQLMEMINVLIHVLQKDNGGIRLVVDNQLLLVEVVLVLGVSREEIV